jgi:hypothetical protein
MALLNSAPPSLDLGAYSLSAPRAASTPETPFPPLASLRIGIMGGDDGIAVLPPLVLPRLHMLDDRLPLRRDRDT